MSDNIVGKDHLKYVKDQINVRQDVLGKSNRTPGDIAWMNGRNAWVRLISSVDIKDSIIPKYNPTLGKYEEISNNGKEDRNQFLGLNNYSDQRLSSELILQGGTLNSDGSQKSGVTNSNSNLPGLQDNYGFGGNEFGLKPIPGITSFSTKNFNNGALREATLTITAHNKKQFEYLESIYLRLGYTMLLEWGNTSYVYKNENGDVEYKQNRASLKNDFLNSGITGTSYFYTRIENLRKETQGNYDASLAKVQNFSWEFTKNGTYEITLKLITIGSVVDSLKLNVIYDTLIKGKDNNTIIETTNSFLTLLKQISGLNQDDIEGFIKPSAKSYLIQGAIGVAFSSPATLGLASSLLAFFSKEVIKTKTTFDSIVRFPIEGTDESKVEICRATFGKTSKLYTYIRFNFILEALSDYLVLDEKGKPCLFEIDTTPQYCFSNGQSISSDPSKMIISYKNKEEEIEIFADGNTKIEPFHNQIGEENQVEVGNIGNVYFSYNYIEDVVNGIINEGSKGLPLQKFIKTLLNTINELLGGVNKLNLRLTNKEFINSEETSTSVIRQVIEIYDEVSPFDVETLYPSKNDSEFVIYGIPNSKGSFVTDFNFTTNLSSNTGTMIAIGAQANGQAVGEDATLFSKWNHGLVDRIIPKKLDTDKRILDEVEEVQEYINLIGLYDQYLRFFKGSEVEATVEDEEGNKFIGYSFPNCNLTPSANQKSLQGFTSTQTSFFNKFYTVSAIANKTPTPLIGFIPMNLSLTFDGLAGIRIFDKLSINSKFLPSNYGDTLDFIITSVDHKIENNKWETTIGTISKPKNPKKIPLNIVNILKSLPIPDDIITNADLVGYYSYNESALAKLMLNSFQYRTGDGIYRKNSNGNFLLPSQNLKGIGGGEYYPTPLVEIGKAGGFLKVNVPGKGFVESKGIKFANADGLRGQDGVFHLSQPAALKLLEFAQFCESQGKTFQINSAFRSLDEQEQTVINAKKRGSKAAKAGNSPHGLGGAIDIQELITRKPNSRKMSTDPEDNKIFRKRSLDYKFWTEHAPKYGWYNPYRLRDKDGYSETWHWEFWGVPGEQLQIKPPSSPKEDPSTLTKVSEFFGVEYLGFESVPENNTLALTTYDAFAKIDQGPPIKNIVRKFNAEDLIIINRRRQDSSYKLSEDPDYGGNPPIIEETEN